MFNCVQITLYIIFFQFRNSPFCKVLGQSSFSIYNEKIMARNSFLLEEVSDFHEERRLLFVVIP